MEKSNDSSMLGLLIIPRSFYDRATANRKAGGMGDYQHSMVDHTNKYHHSSESRGSTYSISTTACFFVAEMFPLRSEGTHVSVFTAQYVPATHGGNLQLCPSYRIIDDHVHVCCHHSILRLNLIKQL